MYSLLVVDDEQYAVEGVMEAVWMPSMVPASACVKSTIPEAGQTGRNISAEFRR